MMSAQGEQPACGATRHRAKLPDVGARTEISTHAGDDQQRLQMCSRCIQLVLLRWVLVLIVQVRHNMRQVDHPDWRMTWESRGRQLICVASARKRLVAYMCGVSAFRASGLFNSMTEQPFSTRNDTWGRYDTVWSGEAKAPDSDAAGAALSMECFSTRRANADMFRMRMAQADW